jgi:TonB family protein
MAAKQPDHHRSAEAAKVRDMLEYRAALDSTLPPTPLKELLSAGGANIFVLSIDQELIGTVKTAAGEQYPVFVISSWPELTAAIDSGRCGIALLDGALIGDRLAKRLAELGRHSSRLVILVAAERANAQELIGYLSDRKIHRLLIKPPAPGITRLLLESAVSRSIQLREAASSPEPMLSDIRPRSHVSGGPGRWPAWILATALVSLVAGVLVVAALTRVMWQPMAAGADSRAVDSMASTEGLPTENVAAVAIATQPERAPAVDRTEPTDPLDDLLMRAQLAFAEGRLAEPAGENALDYYLTVLATEPTHAAARDGLADVVEALFTRAEAALVTDSLDVAAATLANIRRAAPASPRLAFLDTQLERSRERVAEQLTAEQAAVTVPQAAAPATTEPASQSSPPAPQSSPPAPQPPAAAQSAPATTEESGEQVRELARLFAAASQRLQGGELVAPQGDSALDHFLTLKAENPDYPELSRLASELTDALAVNVRTALNRRDWTSAESWLGSLARADPDSAAHAALSDELSTVRLQEQYLASAAPASELLLASYEPPEYPAGAERAQIEGWVDLEFIVGRDGSPRELVAVAAEPIGSFEEAAITAVSQYRYTPFELDGKIFERRVRLRLRFNLE